MLIKNKAIVLKTVDYSETSVVLKCFTDTHGMQSFMVNGVRSKKGSIRPSQLQPLTLLELECYHQQNKNLQRIKELQCVPQLMSMHFDLVKSSIGIFMAEVIHKTVKDENHVDAPLFTFLYNSIQILDLQNDKVANFPIYFLVHLTKYLGFFPKGLFSETTNGFDLREGIFEAYSERNPYQLSPLLSQKLSYIIQHSVLDVNQFDINYQQRAQLLDCLIEYFQQHIEGLLDIKSHKILAEVLG
jgi:DNA repair protein RecO (recombination protein O)